MRLPCSVLNAPLLLLADYANVTADDKLNVMGIFTYIRSVNFPAVHPQMYLVAQLSASSAEYGRKFKFEIKLLDADATKSIVDFYDNAEVPTRNDGQPVVMNYVIGLVNIIFEKPGSYQFSLLIDDDEKASHSLEVVRIALPL